MSDGRGRQERSGAVRSRRRRAELEAIDSGWRANPLLADQRALGNRTVQRRLAQATVPARWILGQQVTWGNRAVQRQLTRYARPPVTHGVVQRHSTHEHYLLGSLRPDDIAAIPLVREQAEQRAWKTDKAAARRREEVLHLLRQEMDRLITWQHEAPAQQLAAQEQRFGGKIGVVKKVSDEWQVPYVEIPTKGGTTVICTYGELNTLADMFGNLADLKKTRPEAVIRMLQGVRQRVYLVLHRLYEEVSGKTLPTRVGYLDPETTFKGAVGFTGKEKSPIGRGAAIKGYENVTREQSSGRKYPFAGGEMTQSNASAALARNACHFAPETWNTWRRYHSEARRLAMESWASMIASHYDPINTAKHRAEAKRLANEALLHSGFGDHFLQDAYASGHLIDKTKIMRWMVEWLHTEGRVAKSATWSMIRAIAKQDMQSDPQMLENVQGGLTEKLMQMGIKLDSSIVLLMWWRRNSADNSQLQSLTAKELRNLAKNDQNWPLSSLRSDRQASALLDELAELGFARKKQKPVIRYELLSQHINVLKPGKKAPYHAKTTQSTPNYHHEAQEFLYEALNKFLDSTYIQKITNYLHDKFCVEGLSVQTDGGDEIGKIYGDANMLNAGAQQGVAYAAETGRMAREAIYELIQLGPQAKVPSIDAIEGRFPRKVVLPGDAGTKSLAEWHAELKQECMRPNGLFSRGVKGIASTGAKRLITSLAGGKALTPVEQVLAAERTRGGRKPPHPLF